MTLYIFQKLNITLKVHETDILSYFCFYIFSQSNSIASYLSPYIYLILLILARDCQLSRLFFIFGNNRE